KMFKQTAKSVSRSIRLVEGKMHSDGRLFSTISIASDPTHTNPDRPIYLDNQSTTPLDPRVLDKMMPFLTEKFGNPHSSSHFHGWEAEDAVEHARKQVADLIGADPKEIFFTSGATESNNIALKGVSNFYKKRKNHIVTTQTEHKCVLDSCRWLEANGFEVT